MQPTAQAVGGMKSKIASPSGAKDAIADGNFPPSPAVQLNRKKKRPNHVHIPPLVHPLHTLLAARHPRAHRLPIHLAPPAPVPNRRRSRPRRPRTHLPRHHPPLPPPSRPLSRLIGPVPRLGGRVPHVSRPLRDVGFH